jgi:hypothetical protein
MTKMYINSICGEVVKFLNTADDDVCSYDWALNN